MQTNARERIVLATCLLTCLPSFAQTFSSGSDGSFGPLNVTSNRTVDLPPDGILNCTTINVSAGVALKLNPNLSLAQDGYAWDLTYCGHFPEALLHQRKAVELDPLSAWMNADLSLGGSRLGQPPFRAAFPSAAENSGPRQMSAGTGQRKLAASRW